MLHCISVWLLRALTICALCWPFQLSAEPFGATDSFLPVEEAYQLQVAVAADRVVLDWMIAPGYYLYRERMKLDVQLGEQAQAFDLQASAGERKYDDYFERETEVYYHEAHLTLLLHAPPRQAYTLLVESQGCADAGLCYPPQKQYFRVDPVHMVVEPLTEAPVTAMSTAPVAVSAAGFAPPSATHLPSYNLPLILLMALAGGLILNLMPCVFPVLSLKVFAMAGQRERDDEAHWHSWVYAAGVVVSFVAVAALMLALRAGGEAIGWGFQLQEPLFVSVLVYLFFVLGLSFSGVIHLGGSLMGLGQELVAGSPVRSSFFTGVLAVVVASPCSVPFMGVALGYAVGQTEALALTVFAVLGFGMALPFIVLAYWPRLLHGLPAPGPWMERLRQFLAFPLYATAVWLLWVLGQQGGEAAMIAVLAGLVLLAMAGWLWRDASARRWEKVLALGLLVVALVLPQQLVLQSCAAQQSVRQMVGQDAEAYSEARLLTLRAEGRPVLVNATASWCITCLVNEKVALSRPAVRERLQEKGIVYLKADWTNRDPAITSLLQQYGRNGVPLYLYFPAGGGEAMVLPQILREALLLEVLR